MTTNQQTTRQPIAVIGVSALFPGSVDSTGFWNDILSGADRMTDVPSTHWLIDDHYDADPTVPDKTYGRRGGFLEPIDFDAMGFGIPPSVMPSTDTAQLLALIVAQRVLDDAMRGQFIELDRTRASVILGVTSGQELFGAMASRMNRPMWLQGMRRAGIAEDVAQEACDRILALHPEWTESTFPGLLGNVVAGRIANRLDLGGTNCVTDAACASSFSAISMGINELYLGDSDLVIAGGVDTMNDIFMYMCFSKTPALSKSEDIRPFSDQADGTMLGEGIGMVALKRLEDAERDGNDIYCVVNGVGASSDGRSKSVYAPVSSGQARALDNAYAKTSYGPETVELVEAHGTGTVAGDAAEFGGLELAFNATGRADRQWCALGSVKSQIGHTKAAAGAAGLFKVVMALHHKVLPQTAKIDEPNPKLDLEHSPFHLNTRTRPWVRGSDHERRGSVSSFGFGGSNFHIALSEYVGTGVRAPRLRSADVELVVLGGSDPADLIRQARQHAEAATLDGYLSFLAQTSQRAYTAAASARLAITARDEAELRDKLDQAITFIASDPAQSMSTPNGIHYGTGECPGDVAFVFPGQGSQYLFMGSDLAINYAEAMGAWDLAADQEWDETSLHDVVFPITSFEEGADSANQSLLRATHWAQPAIGTTSLGLLRVLDAIGLEAKHVGGHSFGEITALHAAGALSEADMIRVARQRGILMAEAAQTPGSMTAVTGSIEAVREIVEQSSADVVIANHNSQRQVVLSGPTDAIEQIESELNAVGVAAKRLPVATAFHSAVVSGASDAFAEFLDDITFTTPVVPVHSNETVTPYPDDVDEMRAQLARQLSRPVRFVEMIEAMYASGARTFVEVGPSSVLTGLIGTILDGRDHVAVPLDRKGRGGLSAFFDGLGRLAAAGVDMQLDALWREYGDMANPHDVTQPKLAIAIGGSNHDSPYPPHDLNELAEANPMTIHAPIDTAGLTVSPAAEAIPSPSPAARIAPAPAPPAPAPLAAQAPVPVAAVAAPTAPAHATAAHAPDAGVLAAYQSAQQQTAAAHSAYLNSMAQAHTAFLDAAQQGIAVLGQLAGAVAAAPTQTVSTPSPVVPAVTVAPAAPVAQAAPAPSVVPVVAPPTQPDVMAPAPIVDTSPNAAPMVADPAPVAVSTGVSVVEMTPLLLGVVSDRTGYPAEMLNREMELESDLGIDSIKRVEILSAMQDLVPDLPDVDLAVMAGLATLGEIVDYLSSQVAAAPALSADVAPAPAVATAVSAVEMTPLLLGVVSDRTGYPAEMLNREMELESDLGIDSIKRVEILSAMQDLVPDLPDVDLAVMAGLATLGEIVDYLSSQVAAAPAVSTGVAPAPAVATGVSTAVSVVEMTPLLLGVVSDRTGYPAEMLNREMELESDLGIDSIKRVEILSAMQDLVPDLPDVDLAVMAGLATLGEIVDYLSSQIGSPSPAVSPAVSPGGVADTSVAADVIADGVTSSFGRFVVRTTPATANDVAAPGLFDGTIIVTDDGAGIAEALVAILVGHGVDAAISNAGNSLPHAGTIYLGNLRATPDVDGALALNRDAFASAQEFARSAQADGLFVVVDDQNGAFGYTGSSTDTTRVWASGLSALARTAAIEWPTATVRAIDIERGDRSSDAIATAIAEELLHGGHTPEIGLAADGTRVTLTAAPVDVEPGALPLGPTDVIVVSGGGRGVTAATMIELARASSATFVLLGRSHLDDEPEQYRSAVDDAALKRIALDAAKEAGTTMTPAELDSVVGKVLANREIRATVASIGLAGGIAHYRAVDVTDLDAVEQTLASIRADVGPIAAVVHGAGVLADKLIADKLPTQFDRVFDTKVVGLRNLLSATSDDDLKVLCLFSSVAARTGNVGQVDYAMANEVLNKVAISEHARRGDRCVVKSLGWGPWAGGMVTPALKRHFESMGVELIGLDVGARMFVDELSSPQTDQVEIVLGGGVLAGPGDAERLAQVSA